MLSYVLEQIFNGLCQGGIYALMAIGYSMIAGVTGLVTFTYGEVIMIGAFASYYCYTLLGGSVWLGILSAFVCSGLLGILIYKVCYEHFLNAPSYICLVCTIGFSMIIKSLAQVFFGGETKGMPTVFEKKFYDLGPLHISNLQLLIFGVVIALSLLLTIYLLKTKAGMAFRSVSQDKTAAALLGIYVNRTMLLGNIVGCALGGVGGALFALYYTKVYPLMGGTIGMKAFSSAILGGLNNVAGAAGGGVIIGVCENVGLMFISTGLRDVIAFGFLIIVLLLKPQGLFGRKKVVKL